MSYRTSSSASRQPWPRRFTTPLIALTVVTALLYVVVKRSDRRLSYGPLPRYPQPAVRSEPFLVLGEQHHPTEPTCVSAPT